uniref:Thioredoxin domain-containing protein n=1 Tax=Anolis carolinensis TaxID=28377 RepID=A0A803SL25_ANOCA
LLKQRELEEFLKNAGPQLVVIDFSAKWCGPCKMIRPTFHVSLILLSLSTYFCQIVVTVKCQLFESGEQGELPSASSSFPCGDIRKASHRMVKHPGVPWSTSLQTSNFLTPEATCSFLSCS